MATFLIADTHFCHRGIIDMCGRPFANEREMDVAMIEGWNAVVRKEDTVIHLGDFAHRAADDRVAKIFAALNGKKHLIRGNHDGKATMALPWESISYAAVTTIDSAPVTLCHYAWRSWPRQRRGALMLFGHHHGRLAGNQQSMDIGVDVMGWAPVKLQAIKQRLVALPSLVDPEAAGGDLENDNGVLTP